MLQRTFIPIKDKIFSWTFRMIILSIGLSIISIFVTTDVTRPDTPFLDTFISSFSNFSFFLGLIAVGTGLVIAFFKRPELNTNKQSTTQAFKPKYRKQKASKDNVSKEEESLDNPPLFSPRELILIFSGSLSILGGITAWILYLIAVNIIF